MQTILSINLIYSNPKVRAGRPCIVGTTLRVTDVVMMMSIIFIVQPKWVM